MKLRSKVIGSVFKRNFSGYFSGVIGYLFIVAFVVAGGMLAFNARFFTANEPNLDQLSEWFPLLLLFIIPAITMSTWADEQRAGTDELLFTLPATDIEVLLGKYFAVLAVYSVALLFSMSHVLVLMFLGNPDPGLIFATYLGYWLAGAALLSAGMVASMLTNSTAVAFILGVVICGIPVFVGELGQLADSFFGWASFRLGISETMGSSGLGLQDAFANLGLREQFRDFGMGVISLSSVTYFVLFTAFMLFVNLVLISRRHWKSSARGDNSLQYLTRAISLAVVFGCLVAWAGYTALRADATSERLFSLSESTKSILGAIESERPIEIQAYLSPEVPRDYVDTRKQLVGLLRQYDHLAGKNLQVRYVDVEPFSEEAEEAEHFGIEPVRVMSERDGRYNEEEVYLGAVVISSYDKVVVPFFGKGLPIEYELTRSVQTVANEKRLTVGVLQTDVGLMSGNEWQIVTELKKQYNVEDVSADTPIDDQRFDVLLAVMPSSLTDPQMDNLVTYVKTGKPALIFDDPFPLFLGSQFGVSNAPRQPKPRAGGGMMGMMGGQAPPEQKADGGRATRLLDALGIHWEYDRVIFDFNNPHPEFEERFSPEWVFVTKNESDDSFNEQPITRDLQEIVTIYGGAVSKNSGDNVTFDPLITTTPNSGILRWEEFVDEAGINFFTMQPAARPRPDPMRISDLNRHVVAARVKSDAESSKVNAIFVSDVDMIADVFFQERTLGFLDIDFDNVTFVLNAVDSLAGDETFVDLRSRRAQHRTLSRIESQKKVFQRQANDEEKLADQQAKEELEKRKEQLGKRLKEIEENQNLDPRAKVQLIQQAQMAEQQRMNLAEAQIEQKKNKEIGKIRATTNRKSRSLESLTRWLAVCIPPIPAMLLGLGVLWQRTIAEKRTVTDKRRRD